MPRPRSPSPAGPQKPCSAPSQPRLARATKSSSWTRLTTAMHPPYASWGPRPSTCRWRQISARTGRALPACSRPARGCSSSAHRTTPVAVPGQRKTWPPFASWPSATNSASCPTKSMPTFAMTAAHTMPPVQTPTCANAATSWAALASCCMSRAGKPAFCSRPRH